MHRHAEELRRAFSGRVVEASSPQGRFADEAKAIDGARLPEPPPFDPDPVLITYLERGGKPSERESREIAEKV